MTEKQFQQQVLAAAQYAGFLCYHTFDSRRSEPGFPDLVCVRDGELIVAELKTDKGTLSPAQNRWIGEFRRVADERGIKVVVWRPRDWDKIVATLQRKMAA